MSEVEVVVAVVIGLGLVGILVPVLPAGGSLVIGAGVLGWAWWRGTPVAWVVFVVAAVLLLVGMIAQYAVPARRLHDAGVPASTQLVGAAFGFVGLFVVPVVGLFLGFVLGVYVAEVLRVGSRAWGSTKSALKAVGLSVVIELVGGVLATVAWIVGLVVT